MGIRHHHRPPKACNNLAGCALDCSHWRSNIVARGALVATALSDYFKNYLSQAFCIKKMYAYIFFTFARQQFYICSIANIFFNMCHEYVLHNLMKCVSNKLHICRLLYTYLATVVQRCPLVCCRVTFRSAVHTSVTWNWRTNC